MATPHPQGDDSGKHPGRNGKISLWPMTLEDALERVVQAPPPPRKRKAARTSAKSSTEGQAPAQSAR